jgi:hypothetical protein
LVVEPLGADPLVDARYSLPPSQVVGYRWRPDGGDA